VGDIVVNVFAVRDSRLNANDGNDKEKMGWAEI